MSTRHLEARGKPLTDPAHDYIHFDEIEDVLASVDLVALVAPLGREKPQCWKWIIIGTHSALQGAMVCAFADSTQTSILTDQSAKEILAWYDSDEATRGKRPKERLADFGELLKRCTRERPNFKPLVLTPNQRRDIKRLHCHFRNNFAHFTPKGWSIEKVGLPRIAEAALDAVEDLMKPGQWLTIHMDEDQRGRLDKALKTARLALRNMNAP
jgi:hypothetical protein